VGNIRFAFPRDLATLPRHFAAAALVMVNTERTAAERKVLADLRCLFELTGNSFENTIQRLHTSMPIPSVARWTAAEDSWLRDNCNAYASLKVASSAQKRPATDSPPQPPTRLQAKAAKTLAAAAAAAAAAADGAASAANATDSDDPIQEAKRGGRPRGRGRGGSRVKARAV
jgi:hypothetical protein